MTRFQYGLRLFFFSLFLTSQMILLGQTTVKGIILDAQNAPLEFASVSLNDTKANKFIDGTITDQSGNFSLKTSTQGDFQLSIQFLGYETQFISIITNQENDLGEIKLIESASDLGVTITVTAEKPVIERIEDRLVFNIASSPLKSGYSGMEIIQRTPNVFIDNDDNILTRNGVPQVMVNGRLLNLTGENLMAYIQNIQSDNIKSIEVQTNPAANSDAANLGGVINIILKKKPVGMNGNVRVSYNTPGDKLYEVGTATNLNYGGDRWNIYGSYNYIKRNMDMAFVTDIFYNDTEDYLKTDIAHNYKGERHNYQLGFVTEPWKNHEIGAEFFGSANLSNSIDDSDISLTNKLDTIDFGTFDSKNDRIDNVNSTVLNYTWHLDTLKSTWRFLADRTTHESKHENNVISAYQLGELTDIQDRNNFENQTNVLALQTDFVKNLKSGYKFELGGKRTETKRKNILFAEDFNNGEWIENSRSSQLNYDEVINAGYANLSKKFKDKHFVKAGVRMENTELYRLDVLLLDTLSKNYTDWFPSFFYSYDLPNGGSLSANYSRRVRRPSFRDLNSIIRKINDFRYMIGNPDLEPEYIDQYEVIFQKKKHTVSAYYNIYNNAMNGVYYLEDGIAFYQRQNRGYQTQYGLEYNISGDVTDWLSFRQNVRLYHRKFTTEEGIDMFQQTSFDLQFSSNIKIDETTGIDISARYWSKRADAFYEAIPFYWVEFFVKKSFFDKKLECRIYFNDPLNLASSGNDRSFPEITTSLRRKARSRSIMFWARYNFATKTKASTKKNKSDRAGRSRI